MKTVLFVCTENSNRSQMAEAFARIHGAEWVEAYSAGSSSSGIINPIAIAAMRDKGYDLSKHRSKSIGEMPSGPYDCVISMGCGDTCPTIAGRYRENWELPDPKHLPPAKLSKIRDDIEQKVLLLLARIQASAST